MALALAACAVTAPPVASAAPVAQGSIDAQMKAKQAEAASIEAQLRELRTQLATQLEQYDRASTDLEIARQDLLITTARLEALDAQVTVDQARLEARAIVLYKTGELDALEALLGTSSMRDFIESMVFIVHIQDNDARLLSDLRTTRDESASLRAQQERREADLMALRLEAAARKAQIESSVAAQDALMRSIAGDIAKLVQEQEAAAAAAAAAAAEAASRDGGSEPPVGFTPNTVISEVAFLAAGSMSADGIQTFLNGQAGDLKSYRGADHNGVTKTAAQMIFEAAGAWGVSPKVVIATLQKEQSLISKPGASQYALDWAMGCGKAEGYTIESYKGFGNQVWHGARVLMKNRAGWRAGIMLPIDGAAVYPTNAATYTLYRYTPHFQGATSFWRLYWRYWGDPGR